MTSPIGVGSTPVVQSTNDGVLGRDDFLKLLVTQLRHQDPLSPMDATAFAAQLAEFSGLEQLIQVNKSLELQAQGDLMTQVALRTSLAASLIGLEVLGYGGQVDVSGAGQHQVTVSVGGTGGVGEIKIFDEFGNTVATRSLGVVSEGLQQKVSFNMDGVPPGKYAYQITVTDQNGSVVPVEHFTVGRVEGVLFDRGQIGLRLENGMLINLDDLAEIEPAGKDGDA